MANWKAAIIGAVVYPVALALLIAASEWFGPKVVLLALGVPFVVGMGALLGVWFLGGKR